MSIAGHCFRQSRTRSTVILWFLSDIPGSSFGSTAAIHIALTPLAPCVHFTVYWKCEALVWINCYANEDKDYQTQLLLTMMMMLMLMLMTDDDHNDDDGCGDDDDDHQLLMMVITMSVKMKAGEDHNGDSMSHKLALLFFLSSQI